MSVLHEGESVVTAWAERCSGPGWSNSVVWVLLRSRDFKLRIIGLQPGEQTEGLRAMFGVSAVLQESVRAEAESALVRNAEIRTPSEETVDWGNLTKATHRAFMAANALLDAVSHDLNLGEEYDSSQVRAASEALAKVLGRKA